MINVKFDSQKFLNPIRRIIKANGFGEYTPIEKHSGRFQKIDAHSIYALAFLYSSEGALSNGDVVLASIAQYYCIYHLSFALIALDLNKKDEDLVQMSHSIIKGTIKDFVEKGIVSNDFLLLLYDLNVTRNYFNYLNGDDGFEKISMISKRFLLRSLCFGNVNFCKISECSMGPLKNIIENYFLLLHEIEINIISKSKTEGERPEIFQSIRRISDFDVYGEDLLDGFFSEEVIDNIEQFLDKYDVYNMSLKY